MQMLNSADDINLFVVNPDVVELNLSANRFVKQLHQCCFISNKLSINISKTCYMVFPSKNVNMIKIVINN
jgi:hypothetical protein